MLDKQKTSADKISKIMKMAYLILIHYDRLTMPSLYIILKLMYWPKINCSNIQRERDQKNEAYRICLDECISLRPSTHLHLHEHLYVHIKELIYFTFFDRLLNTHKHSIFFVHPYAFVDVPSINMVDYYYCYYYHYY